MTFREFEANISMLYKVISGTVRVIQRNADLENRNKQAKPEAVSSPDEQESALHSADLWPGLGWGLKSVPLRCYRSWNMGDG